MKKILSLLFMAFIISLTLTSCDIFKQHVSATDSTNATDEDEVTVIDLVAPSYIKYENGSLKWEKIENASKYYLLINEKEHYSSVNNYTVSFDKSQNFTVKIKAIGYKTNKTVINDSSWSKEYSFDYNRKIPKLDNSFENIVWVNEYGKDEFGNQREGEDRYKTNTISWDKIDNAVSYTIWFFADGKEIMKKTPTLNYCYFEYLTNIDFTIKLKANGDGVNYYDSEIFEYERVLKYRMNSEQKETYTYFEKGLGYGFDIYSKSIYNSRSRSSILDYNKISKKIIIINDAPSAKRYSVCSESFEELAEAYDNSFSVNFDAKVPIKFVTLNLGASYSNMTSEEYNSTYSRIYYKDSYEKCIKQIGIKLSSKDYVDYLNEDFLSKLKACKDTDDIIENIIKVYGTHLITEAYLGGVCDYSYYMVATSSALSNTDSQTIGANIGASIGKKLEANVSTSITWSNSYTEKNNTAYENICGKYYGGDDYSFSYNDSNKSLSDTASEWFKSINDKNSVIIDYEKDSLISYSEILSQLGKEYESVVKLYEEAYNEYLDELDAEIIEVLNKNRIEVGNSFKDVASLTTTKKVVDLNEVYDNEILDFSNYNIYDDEYYTLSISVAAKTLKGTYKVELFWVNIYTLDNSIKLSSIEYNQKLPRDEYLTIEKKITIKGSDLKKSLKLTYNTETTLTREMQIKTVQVKLAKGIQ